MVTYTTTYNFAKPTVGDDEDLWGGYLNGNFDTLESLLKGTTALSAIDVTGNITVGGSIVFEGATADAFETTFAVTDPTADNTITLPDASGTVPLIDSSGHLIVENDDPELQLISTDTAESHLKLTKNVATDLWALQIDHPNAKTGSSFEIAIDGTSALLQNVTSGVALSQFRDTVKIQGGDPFNDDASLEVSGLNGSTKVVVSSADARIGIGTTSPTVSLDVATTDAIQVPDGTTAQRPASPANGMFRYSTTDNQFEGYINGAWGALGGSGGGGGTVEATASGALSNGDAVILNSDGTVSVVENTTETQALGSAEVFNSANSFYNATVYDPNTKKIVIGYVDNGNSNKGTAVVGTVSGTSITFGTPVVFEQGAPYYLSAVYDEREEKVVFSYRDLGNSSRGTAIVGTVSGTSISFGTAVVFNTGSTYFGTSVYDPSTGKVVIAYRDVGNSNYGTAVVGTVSGTSITFGSEVVFEQADTRNLTAVYEPNFGKIVICYEDAGNSNVGTAIVGTVNKTTITFGDAVVFSGSDDADFIRAVYDESAKKVVVFYQNETSADKGEAIVGTVSGDTISFGSSSIFNNAGTLYNIATYNPAAKSTTIHYHNNLSGEMEVRTITVEGNSITASSKTTVYSGTSQHQSAAYDPDTKAVIMTYTGASNYGNSRVFRSAYTASNITSSNFIGFADAAYSDAATATINVVGSVNEGQSGLTAGKGYYVQNDGSLEKYPDNPEVFAGVATSATKIIVKG